jgi:hypothetical protein
VHILLSLDIERAFLSVETWLIDDVMTHYGFPYEFVRLTTDTLTGSTVSFRLRGRTTEAIPIEVGVRQGDPLCATISAIVINPLITKLERNTQGKGLLGSVASGPEANADDIDIIANEPATIDESAALAAPRINGSPRRFLPNEEFRVLGVYFTAELDWQAHITKMIGALRGALEALKRRAITMRQMVDVLNSMIIASVTYGMCVVPFAADTLKTMDDMIVNFLRVHSKHTGRGLGDYYHLPVVHGGLGLLDVAVAHDAQIINTWTTVLNGPPCPAQRALRSIEREFSMARGRIDLPASLPGLLFSRLSGGAALPSTQQMRRSRISQCQSATCYKPTLN